MSFVKGEASGYCAEKSYTTALTLSPYLLKFYDSYPNVRVRIMKSEQIDHQFIVLELNPSESSLKVSSFRDLDEKMTIILDPWLNNYFLLEKLPFYWRDLLLPAKERTEKEYQLLLSNEGIPYQENPLIQEIGCIEELVCLTRYNCEQIQIWMAQVKNILERMASESDETLSKGM